MKAKNGTMNPNGGNEYALPTRPANSSAAVEVHNCTNKQPGPTKDNLVDTSPRVETESNVGSGDDRFHNK